MIQRELETIGKYGCYFLSLLKIGGDGYIKNFYEYYKVFNNLGWMDADCTILNPSKILNLLLGKNVEVVKSETLDENADFIVEYWFNPRTGFHHFKLPDWDPLGESVTCKEGYIESYRLFYVN